MNLIMLIWGESILKVLQLWERRARECRGHSLKIHSRVILEVNNNARKVDYKSHLMMFLTAARTPSAVVSGVNHVIFWLMVYVC